MSSLQNIIKQKKQEARDTIAEATRQLRTLIEQEAKIDTAGISRWLGNSFESSSSLTPEFAQFASEYKYKKELTRSLANAPAQFSLVVFTRGHFYLSGFIRNSTTNKFCYFSTPDVRYNTDGWHNNILVRTAKHDKDYTGGSNNSATWNNLVEKIINLTQ